MMAVSESTSDARLGNTHSEAPPAAATNVQTNESFEGEEDLGETAPWKKRARARLHGDVEPQETQRHTASGNSSASTNKSVDSAWTPPRMTLAAACEAPIKSAEHRTQDRPAKEDSLSTELVQSLAAAAESSRTGGPQDSQDPGESQHSMSSEIAERLAAARANSTVEAYLKELRWRADGFQRLQAAITWHPDAWEIFAMVLRWFPKRDEILASAMSERPGDYGSWSKATQSQGSQGSVADSSVAQAVSGSPNVNEDAWEMSADAGDNPPVPAENAICLSSDEEDQEGQPAIAETSQVENSSAVELHCHLSVDQEFYHTPTIVSISLGSADGLTCNWYEEAALIFKSTSENNEPSIRGTGKQDSKNCLDDLLQASEEDSHEREVWTQCLDPRTGRFYYHNGQETRWELPAGPNVCIQAANGALVSLSPLRVSSICNLADQRRRPTASRRDETLRLPVSHVKGVHIAADGKQIILIFMPSLEFIIASSQMRAQIPTLTLTFRAEDASQAAETLLQWLPHAEVEDYASGRDLSTSAAPPILRLGRLQVRPRDLLFFNDGDFLNDTILDFTLRLGLELVAPAELQDSVYLASSLFFKQLTAHGAETGEKGWENVRTWTRHLSGGLMSRECVLVPMNANEVHWWLAVVCRPSGKWLKGPQRIVCLDSSPYPFTERARITTLKGYLNREWKERGGGEPPAEPLKAVMAAQAKQKNLVDCGVFSIEYMVHLFRNPSALSKLGTKRQRRWFSQYRVSHRRQRLRWMISRLAAAGQERKEVDVHNLLKDQALRRLVLDAFLDDPPPRKKTLGSKFRRILARRQAKLKKTKRERATNAAEDRVLDSQRTAGATGAAEDRLVDSQRTAMANGSLVENRLVENTPLPKDALPSDVSSKDEESLQQAFASKRAFDDGDSRFAKKRELGKEEANQEKKKARFLPAPRGKAQSKITGSTEGPVVAQATSPGSEASVSLHPSVNTEGVHVRPLPEPATLPLPSHATLPEEETKISPPDPPLNSWSYDPRPSTPATEGVSSSTPSSSTAPTHVATPLTNQFQCADAGAGLDLMLRKNIEIMARQIVKMGKTFHDLVLKMNEGKPQFSFLFGGEGAEYYEQMLQQERARATAP